MSPRKQQPAKRSKPKGKKTIIEKEEKKKIHTNITDDDKEVIKEWLEDNPIIYNKRLPNFRDTRRSWPCGKSWPSGWTTP